MRAAALWLVALSLAAGTAGADWLVLRDGARVETRGAWTEKGRLVVFTAAADGRLASLRADTIDLAASRRATAEAAAAAAAATRAEAAPAAPPPQAVRRITNADIPAGTPAPAAAAAAAEAGAAEDAAPAPAVARELQVRDAAQELDPFDGHLIVRGTLANNSQRTAAAIELVVDAHGPEGVVLASLPARLGDEALPPGGSTSFVTHFVDVYSGAFALRFAPAATFLESAPAEPASGAAGGDTP